MIERGGGDGIPPAPPPPAEILNVDIHGLFDEMGDVQLDPLNPAVRNHGVYFFARSPSYTAGEFEREA